MEKKFEIDSTKTTKQTSSDDAWWSPETMPILASLGTANLLIFNFTLCTCKSVEIHVFPGTQFVRTFPQAMSIFWLMGYIFSLCFVHRLSYFVCIFGGYCISGCAALAFILWTFLFPATTFGYYMALTSCGVGAFCSGVTRSKLLGCIFNVGKEAARRENQGIAFAGVVSLLITVLARLFVSETRNGAYLTIVVCYGLCALFHFAVAASYKHVTLLSEEAVARQNAKAAQSDVASYGSTAATNKPRKETRPLWMLTWIVLRDLVCVSGNTVITYNVFPAVAYAWAPPYYMSKEWFTVYLNAIYQLGDNTGRQLAAYVLPRTYVPLAVMCRLIFIPLFILTLKYPQHFLMGSLVFRSLQMLTFSMSFGYVIVCTFFYGTSQLTDPREKMRVAPCVAFNFLIGRFIGSFCAFPTK